MKSHEENIGCKCNACVNEIANEGRRGFLKKLGVTGIGLGMAPAMAGALIGENDTALKEMLSSKAVQNGKAQRLTILQTSDIHAQLSTHDEFFWENGAAVYKKRGGLAVLKTMLSTLRAENPTGTLVVDGGDCFQGGGVAALSEGREIVKLMNNIQYDIMLPGNWEVVYGKENMMKDLGGYSAQKICANMYHDTQDAFNGDLMFQPYWTTNIAGIKIGFIGYNDPLTPKRQSPAYSNGIKFTKPETNVAKYIRLLRDYEKCSMVFLMTHMGLAQQVDLANKHEVDGVDYILGADTHERVRQPIQGRYTKVTEPGAFGSFVGRLDVVVENGVIKEHSYELLDVDPEKYKADEGMLKMIEDARSPYAAELDKVIGKTKTPLVRYYVIENPMDNLITDAVMWKFKPDIALSNGFRFCPPLIPDPKTGVADITNDFLWSMLPVNSEAKRAEITGEQVWNWLEKELHNVFAKDPAKRFGGWVVRFNGMEINFTMGKPLGERLNWVKVGGKKLDRLKVYSVVACEREGDPEEVLCRIDGVQKPERLNALLHDVVRDYLKVHSPIAPKIEGRARATDAPSNLLSQLEGYEYEFR
jgi:sulfur-oxidizing protein SoxB